MNTEQLTGRASSMAVELAGTGLVDYAASLRAAAQAHLVPTEIWLAIYNELKFIAADGDIPEKFAREAEGLREEIRAELKRSGLHLNR